jgi:hypothetical protein
LIVGMAIDIAGGIRLTPDRLDSSENCLWTSEGPLGPAGQTKPLKSLEVATPTSSTTLRCMAR